MDDQTVQIHAIGRYQAIDEIGRGGMGIVYRGFDPVIGRTVALKTILFGTGDAGSKDLRERLYREACAAGTLNHPNIVTVYDVVEQAGMTAVAMEFVEGRTLAAVIAERAPLPLDEALSIFEQICSALDYASSRGIVHRDIKPANILMTADGRAKVTDFGVARMAISHLTQTGTVVGSPSYMSPEQIRGRPLDGRSDLFSAVIVLYEMLTTNRPFAGDDVATSLYRIVHEPPTPITQFNTAVSPAIATVLERALAKEPADRHPTGADMVRELRQAAGGHPGPAPHAPVSSGSGAETVLAYTPAPFPMPTPSGGISSAPVGLTPASQPVAALPLERVQPAPGTVVEPPAGSSPAGARPSDAPTKAAPAARGRSSRAWIPIATAGAALLVIGALAGAVVMMRSQVPPALTDEGGATPPMPAPPLIGTPAEPVVPPTSTSAGPTTPVSPAPGAGGSPAVAPTAPRRPPTAVAAPPPAPAPDRAGTAASAASEPPVDPSPAPPPASAGSGPAYEQSDVDEKPEVLDGPSPVYPPQAQRNGLEDVIVLRVLVSERGEALDLRLLRRSRKDAAFDSAAVEAVRQWKFRPAKRKGAVVKCWYNVGVPFKLGK